MMQHASSRLRWTPLTLRGCFSRGSRVDTDRQKWMIWIWTSRFTSHRKDQRLRSVSLYANQLCSLRCCVITCIRFVRRMSSLLGVDDEMSDVQQQSWCSFSSWAFCPQSQAADRCLYSFVLLFPARICVYVAGLRSLIVTLRDKKFSCHRETARRFVSLNILLSHSRLLQWHPWVGRVYSRYTVSLLYVLPFVRHSTSNNGVTLTSALGIIQGHWKSYIPFESLGMVSYSHSTATMAVSFDLLQLVMFQFRGGCVCCAVHCGFSRFIYFRFSCR